jgi:FtsP/CotA-like multicopper oxidase with cupredoxin domain
VASDGNDVEPVEVDRLIIAVSETYDIVVTFLKTAFYEFMATTEDEHNPQAILLATVQNNFGEMPRLKYFEG